MVNCTGFIGAAFSDIIHVFAKRVVEMHVLIIGITKGWAMQPQTMSNILSGRYK
jgi:hypothetical protein